MVNTRIPAKPEACCPAFCALVTGDSDFLTTSYNNHDKLWPAGPTTQNDVMDTGNKGPVARMIRVPGNTVQQALVGRDRKITSLLKPVARMSVIIISLVTLDPAAGVGVLILSQHGIDPGVVAGDMPTIGLCALLVLYLVIMNWCSYSLQVVLATRVVEPIQRSVCLHSLGYMLCLGFP